MTHTELVEAMMEAASAHGLARLFKNQSGVAKQVSIVAGKKKTFYTPYGVGPNGGGGHDLIGFLTPSGRFCSLDAKIGRDKLSDDQIKWMRWVILGGGIAGEFRSVEEGLALLRS